MAITEESRHHLYLKLEEVLGSEEAATMMEHLPPVGWADVVRRRDLDEFEARMDLRFGQMDGRFEQMDGRFEQMDGRFEQMDGRFEQLDVNFGLRLDAGLSRLESRILREFGAYRDQIHAGQRTTQRQVVLALVVALVGVVLAAVGVG
jgi:hypothetical protein